MAELPEVVVGRRRPVSPARFLPCRQTRLSGRDIHAHPVASQLLGQVQGAVRTAEHGFEVVPWCELGQAHAHRDGQRTRPGGDRSSRDGHPDPLGELRRIRDVEQQDGELLAAVAAQEVRGRSSAASRCATSWMTSSPTGVRGVVQALKWSMSTIRAASGRRRAGRSGMLATSKNRRRLTIPVSSSSTASAAPGRTASPARTRQPPGRRPHGRCPVAGRRSRRRRLRAREEQARRRLAAAQPQREPGGPVERLSSTDGVVAGIPMTGTRRHRASRSSSAPACSPPGGPARRGPGRRPAHGPAHGVAVRSGPHNRAARRAPGRDRRAGQCRVARGAVGRRRVPGRRTASSSSAARAVSREARPGWSSRSGCRRRRW